MDDEGMLSGSHVFKYHEVTYNAGSTVYVLVSPEDDAYVRIGRDAGRTSDEFSIPDGWRLIEYIAPEDLEISLPRPTLVIRTENEDFFQGPVEELTEFLNAGARNTPSDMGLHDVAIPAVEQTQFMPVPDDLRDFRYCENLIAVPGEAGVQVSARQINGLISMPMRSPKNTGSSAQC